jgi:hypothetical protein
MDFSYLEKEKNYNSWNCSNRLKNIIINWLKQFDYNPEVYTERDILQYMSDNKINPITFKWFWNSAIDEFKELISLYNNQ